MTTYQPDTRTDDQIEKDIKSEVAEIEKLFGDTANQMSLEISDGYLSIADWESHILRTFLLNNPTVDIDKMFRNFDFDEYDDAMVEEENEELPEAYRGQELFWRYLEKIAEV